MPAPKTPAAIDVVVHALACGSTVANAARKANVGERTVYRRLKDPAFRSRVQAVRDEMFERTGSFLSGAGPTSVKTLVDLQQDATTPPSVRRAAARDVLELGPRFREMMNWETRIAALEADVSKVAKHLKEQE